MIISCNNLSKSFEKYVPSEKKGTLTKQKFQALKNVSLSVNDGETFSIIGANGSGKSTLLKILSGITHPDSGTFEINGRISALLELGVGFHPELNGWENIFLYGSILGIPREDIKKVIPQIIEFSGIADFLDTPVKHYSSGMLARIAFATAININPDVLLVDEILSVGDIEFQSRSLDKIKEFKSKGKTILVVTHETAVATQLSDRILWLDNGEVRETGAPGDIAGHYMKSRHTEKVFESAMQKIVYNHASGIVNQSEIKISINENGKPFSSEKKFQIETNKKLELMLDFSTAKIPADSSLHIIIKKESGWIISDTKNDQIINDAKKQSSTSPISVVFDQIPLVKGRYFIYSIISDKSDPETVYAYSIQPLTIDVQTPGFKFDFFMIDHPAKWALAGE